MSDCFIGFIIGSFTYLLGNLLCEPIRNKWRRECKFDCSKCIVWDCSRYACLRYKEKYDRKLKDKDLN